MRKITLIIIIFLILIISFFVYPKKNNEILATKENNSNFISIMLEEETGTGNYREGESFPSEGYFLNKNLSKCINGSKINFSEGNLIIKGNKSDRCYAYFDKDELGSICRGQNLSECFTKNYKKDSSIIYHDGNADYPEEENYELEAEDLSYRYTGDNDVVHNYVCLDNKENGKCLDEDLYRIIGFFKNEEENYEIKLIKASSATSVELGTNGTYVNNNSYTYNGNFKTSLINSVNLNQNYLKILKNYSNNIAYHKWHYQGAGWYDIVAGIPTSTNTIKTTYDYEIGSKASEILSTPVKIGFIYVSDYLYAASSNNWILKPYDYDNINDYRIAVNENWLYINEELTITNRTDINGYPYVIDIKGNLGSSASPKKIRPCFYLICNTKLSNGNGTKENPYRLDI